MDQQQVWQRVCPGKAEPLGVAQMEALARELAELYRGCGAALGGRGAELARHLAAQEESNAALLRGIQALSGTAGPVRRPLPQGKNTVKRALQEALKKTRQLSQEAAGRVIDPVYGGAFAELSQRERGQEALVAELAGLVL